MTQTPEQIAAGLTKAQREALITVCMTNGGGVKVATGHEDHNYGTPTQNPWKRLWELGLIQGKASHAYRVVHTREGWAVRAILEKNNERG